MRGTTQSAAQGLTRHIGLGHGVALYVSAILGAGVLVLPGQAASLAGPAALVSWGFTCAMGLPLAAMFAALARRFPDAGGVASYTRHGLGSVTGGVCGWWFFAAGSVGQTVVPLTGAYYVIDALGVDPGWAYPLAGAILLTATVTNVVGLRVGSGVQVGLALAVAAALLVTIAVAVPEMDVARLHPFAPHGLVSIGTASITLFFAFAGWETVAHLAEEFRDPQRDLPRAVASTVGVITVLYLGIAAAVVLTGTYGTPRTDHVSIGLILRGAFGPRATSAAALVALVISLATTTAFISGVSRLGYSLGRLQWLPRSLGVVDPRGVPRTGVLTVFGIAAAGLAVSAALGWGTEQLIAIPSTLVVAVYLLVALSAARVLHGWGRAAAVVSLLLVLLVAPASVPHLVVPVVVAVLAVTVQAFVRRAAGRSGSS